MTPHFATLSFATKSAAVLTEDGDDQGIIEALVSVFGNVDAHNHVVEPGAFTLPVEQFAAGSKSIPVVWNHDTYSVDGFLGHVVGLVEIPDGLKATMQFDLDDRVAAKAYRLLKGGRVQQYSFAYRVLGSYESADGVTHLTALDISELGPTMYGVNGSTRTLSVKAAAGANDPIGLARARVDAAAVEMAAASKALTDLVAPVGDDNPADKASGASDEEPDAAKSPARTRLSPEEIKALVEG